MTDADQIMCELLGTGLNNRQLGLVARLMTVLASRDGRDVLRDARGLAAERARKYRAKNKDKSGMAGQQDADGASQVRHVTERDAAPGDPLILSSLPLEKRTFEEVRKEEATEKRARGKRKPAVPLPDDWQTKPAHFTAADRLGCPASYVDGKAEDMRIWARSNDARKVDWDQTFHGFLRRDAAIWKKQHANTGNNAKPGSWQGARDDFRAARADLKAGIAAAESGSLDGGESSGPPIRLVAPAGRG